MSLRVHVAPFGMRDFLRDAVRDGGGVVTDDVMDAEAIVYTAPNDPRGLQALLQRQPAIAWVQLPWAGIERYLDVLDTRRLWTAGQGIYARDVAEHILALTLASLRDFKRRATATAWQPPSGRSLHGARVTVFGAGGITAALVPLLAPFGVELTVVRRQAVPFVGAVRTLTLADRVEAVREADIVVVALALTDDTRRLVDGPLLGAMRPDAVLVNVARGGHVDTEALVEALQQQRLGGAALDVTDPEPLPPGHPLWSEERCFITPHCANTPAMAEPVLRERVRDNVRRYLAGETLLGIVDVSAGY